MSINLIEIVFISVSTMTLRGFLYFLSITRTVPWLAKEVVRLVEICLTIAFFKMIYLYSP